MKLEIFNKNKKDLRKLIKNVECNNTEDILAKIIYDFQEKLNFKLSEKNYEHLDLLVKGFFIEDINTENYIVYSIYIIYLYNINKDVLYLFQTDKELEEFNIYFNEVSSFFNVDYSAKYLKMYNDNLTNKKKFYSKKVILITIPEISNDILNLNYIKNMNSYFIEEDFFTEKIVLINDIKAITLYANHKYSLTEEVFDNDFSIYYQSLKLSLLIKDKTELYEEENKVINLNDKGLYFLEDELFIENIFENTRNIQILKTIEDILYVLKNIKKDIDYIISKNEITLLNNKLSFNVIPLIQLIEGLYIDKPFVEIESLSNQILFNLFSNIQGVSTIVSPYRDYLIKNYNLKIKSLSKYKRPVNIKYFTLDFNRDLIIDKSNMFKYFEDTYKTIYLSNELDYWEINHLIFSTQCNEVIFETNLENKSKLLFNSNLELLEYTFRYNKLVYNKLKIYNSLKKKINQFSDIFSLIEYFNKEIMKIENCDSNTEMENLISECFLNIEENNSIYLINLKKELFELININRKRMYSDINLLISNFYYKSISKEDPFSSFEREVYYLYREAFKELFLKILYNIKNKKICSKQTILKKVSF